jgi:hypothetical protein
MTETRQAPVAQDAHSRSAVGRLVILVDAADGTERVTYERRLLDAGAARQWCEEKLQLAGEGTAVLEIQVTEEVWGLRHAWEAVASRHVPETLQLGLCNDRGSITWYAPRAVGSDGHARRL